MANNQAGAIIVALLFGLAGGWFGRTYIDYRSSVEHAGRVPVHKLSSAQGDIVTSNQLIGHDVWRIYLDPLWTPVVSPQPQDSLSHLDFPVDAPEVSTLQTEKRVRVVAQLPGLSEKDVDVQVEKDKLAIKGRKEEQEERNKEFQAVHESFEEIVRLPCAVDGSKARATFRGGQLTVELPKSKKSLAHSPQYRWE